MRPAVEQCLGRRSATEKRSHRSGEGVEARPHLVFVEADVVDGLVEGCVAVEILQLDEVHARLVGYPTERASEIVVGDANAA